MCKEDLSSSLWNAMTGSIGMVQRCPVGGGGSGCMVAFLHPLRGWSYTGTGFYKMWSMPQAYDCVKGIWTMLLTTSFSFWSALKWSDS